MAKKPPLTLDEEKMINHRYTAMGKFKRAMEERFKAA